MTHKVKSELSARQVQMLRCRSLAFY